MVEEPYIMLDIEALKWYCNAELVVPPRSLLVSGDDVIAPLILPPATYPVSA